MTCFWFFFSEFPRFLDFFPFLASFFFFNMWHKYLLAFATLFTLSQGKWRFYFGISLAWWHFFFIYIYRYKKKCHYHAFFPVKKNRFTKVSNKWSWDLFSRLELSLFLSELSVFQDHWRFVFRDRLPKLMSQFYLLLDEVRNCPLKLSIDLNLRFRTLKADK